MNGRSHDTHHCHAIMVENSMSLISKSCLKFAQKNCSRKKAIRMSDSSSDCEIERCESEKEEFFDSVPSTQLFTIKLKKTGGKTYRVIEYELKEGKLLPYTAFLKGRSM